MSDRPSRLKHAQEFSEKHLSYKCSRNLNLAHVETRTEACSVVPRDVTGAVGISLILVDRGYVICPDYSPLSYDKLVT